MTRRLRHRQLSPVAWAVGLFVLQQAAAAQGAVVVAADELQLKPSASLQDSLPASARHSAPSFLEGDTVSGHVDLETTVDGNTRLRRPGTAVSASHLEYYQPNDLAKAQGEVRVNRMGNVFEGTTLELKVDAFEGFFLNTRYRLLANGAHGQSSRVDFLDDKHTSLRDASYTTCPRQPGADWLPDWVLRASQLRFDQEQDIGEADHAVLEFKGVPILPAPEFSFPLSDKRKSGFLLPDVAHDNVDGSVLTLPYYWNIAPQHDLTLYPSWLSRRGVDLGAEFRYLEPWIHGSVRGDFMPSDRLRQRNRWGVNSNHSGNLETGLDSVGSLGLNLNLNRVSDDNYWKDFPHTTFLSGRLLANDATLSWAKGDLSTSLRTLKWQTLQDLSSPITPPYDRAPELNAHYGRLNVSGFDYGLDADVTQFVADRRLTQQPNAWRAVLAAQLSHPWQTPGWYLTPKVQWHATQYRFDGALSDQSTSASRFVPTYSLDSGLVLERETNFWGHSFRQTLEPRALYVYTPFRDQNKLPNYDSASQDFNFASIFNENAFLGNDRISDSDLLTLGATSRLLDPNDGAELARFGVAQRIRFKNQNVTLPGVSAVSERISDVVLGAGVHWNPQWAVDSTVQFNPKTSNSDSASLSGYYNPSPYRVLSASYLYQRGTSQQVDLGWQWPINDLWGNAGTTQMGGQGLGPGRWFSVGRLSYSMQDHRMVDAVAGLEYDAGCWLGRVVLDRLQTTSASANLKISFQLEFVGFTRLGVGGDSLKTFKDNVPRYQYLRDQGTLPSRFSQYD